MAIENVSRANSSYSYTTLLVDGAKNGGRLLHLDYKATSMRLNLASVVI